MLLAVFQILLILVSNYKILHNRVLKTVSIMIQEIKKNSETILIKMITKFLVIKYMYNINDIDGCV